MTHRIADLIRLTVSLVFVATFAVASIAVASDGGIDRADLNPSGEAVETLAATIGEPVTIVVLPNGETAGLIPPVSIDCGATVAELHTSSDYAASTVDACDYRRTGAACEEDRVCALAELRDVGTFTAPLR